MKQLLFLGGLLLLSLSACKKDESDDPVVQPQLPAISQIKWSDNDHLRFIYNEKGQLAELRNQWQYLAGDPSAIRLLVDQFSYDAQGRITQVSSTGGFKANYFYNDNLIEKVEELAPGGEVLSIITYLYNQGRIIGQIREYANGPGELPTTYKYLFSYDARGNLSKQEILREEPGGEYLLLNTVEYLDFDQKVNPAGWTTQYPYLPTYAFHKNNPGKMLYYSPDNDTQTTTYRYEYGANGLPSVKYETRPNGQYTGRYEY
ncbi:MAG: hypothetical protein JNL02_13710 [Saprospiraceae bacterium]|nr:hypothetical protein [Saprospiraceae bacterium]